MATVNISFGGNATKRSMSLFAKPTAPRMIERRVTATAEIRRKFSAFFQKRSRRFTFSASDLDLPLCTHRTLGIENLTDLTEFSRKEVQLLYREFKEETNTGGISLEDFKQIFAKMFPNGDPAKFAELIFNTFELDKNGILTFDGFLISFSILLRGNLEEKFAWIFKLYDTDKDGVLTKRDIKNVVRSVYDFTSSQQQPPVTEMEIDEHADDKMDGDRNGIVTCNEFINFCRRDDFISQNLKRFSQSDDENIPNAEVTAVFGMLKNAIPL
ncbi:Kv channel-interacting protein 1 [Trichinella zimbabwensis]|uniref:Kv channel-interacting protein 1 n=1 Tax=Trichinella zimbabwensis TaxID=268475 RepID=A0A0V1HL91_9BILA|nr:Kv channel-interacting protein 1 [Trichinella zimbabwensis]